MERSGASAGGGFIIVMESFLERHCFQTSRGTPEMYFLFRHEALHDKRLRISKMMKECLLAYVSPRAVKTGQAKAMNRGCRLILSAIQGESGTSPLRVELAKGNVFSDLNGLYMNNKTWGIFESKNIEVLGMLFLFVATFVNLATGEERDYAIMVVHTIFSELKQWLS